MFRSLTSVGLFCHSGLFCVWTHVNKKHYGLACAYSIDILLCSGSTFFLLLSSIYFYELLLHSERLLETIHCIMSCFHTFLYCDATAGSKHYKAWYLQYYSSDKVEKIVMSLFISQQYPDIAFKVRQVYMHMLFVS